MKIFIVSLVGAPFALLTIYALLNASPDSRDLATPVMISGLLIIGVLGLVGLAIWSSRDIHERRQRGKDVTPELNT